MTNSGLVVSVEEEEEEEQQLNLFNRLLPNLPSPPSILVASPRPTLCGPSASLLRRRAIFAYGIGHMLNDLTAACWFTYLLIFLTDLGFSSRIAAIVMLSGQSADGFATIFVGQLIDRFGHYKLWHAGGSILVALSFSFIFGGCWMCTIFRTDSILANTIAYSTFAAIFNTGWAATQVSHMSLANCLTANPTSRVSLIGCRNACTMVANLCLYAIAYTVFIALPAKDAEGIIQQYRWIAGLAILFGSCFVIVFLLSVKEPRLQHLLQPKECPRTSCLSWFKKTLYFQVALVYMLTRLTVNVSQSLIPFYLINDLKMGESSKAVVPAVIYIFSFLVSVGLQEVHWTGSRLKICFASGASLWVCSGILIIVLESDLQGCIYAVSVIIGVGNALMTVASVSMEGILVGLDLSGCAFVYGSLSFLDKLSCGIALYFIEEFQTTGSLCRLEKSQTPCSNISVRLALALVSGGCAFFGMLITAMTNLDISHPEHELREALLSPVGKHPPNKIINVSLMNRETKAVCKQEHGKLSETLSYKSTMIKPEHPYQHDTKLGMLMHNIRNWFSRLFKDVFGMSSHKQPVIPVCLR